MPPVQLTQMNIDALNQWSFKFLGTGSVKSTPLYGCKCAACARARDNSAYQRRPACGLLEFNGVKLLIDAGIHDLEDHFAPGELDGILLTHFHMDHVQGLFPMRWGVAPPLPVFGPDDPHGCDDLLKHPGFLDFSRKTQPFEPFTFKEFRITPLPLVHSKITLGYVIEVKGKRLAYLCDSGMLRRDVTNYLKLAPIDLMILDCDQPPLVSPPRNHNDLNTALSIFYEIIPKKLILTHISHNFDAYLMQMPDDCLPQGVVIGYDQQRWII